MSKAVAAHVLADGRPRLAIGGFWDLELTRNPGGAFGILPQSTLLFFLATLLIVGGVVVWGVRSGQAPLALGLVAGGGLGNLIDRVTRAPRPEPTASGHRGPRPMSRRGSRGPGGRRRPAA